MIVATMQRRAKKRSEDVCCGVSSSSDSFDQRETRRTAAYAADFIIIYLIAILYVRTLSASMHFPNDEPRPVQPHQYDQVQLQVHDQGMAPPGAISSLGAVSPERDTGVRCSESSFGTERRQRLS